MAGGGVRSLMVAANPIGSPCYPHGLLALYVRNRHAFAVEGVDRIIDLVPGFAGCRPIWFHPTEEAVNGLCERLTSASSSGRRPKCTRTPIPPGGLVGVSESASRRAMAWRR